MGVLRPFSFWANPGGPGTTPYEDDVMISPTKRVTIHSFILSREVLNLGFGTFGGISHEIRLAVIPEPSSIVLACCFVMGFVGRRN